jgi:hypothetical protein
MQGKITKQNGEESLRKVKKFKILKHCILHTVFLIGECLTLEIEEICSSETSAHMLVTWRYIPDYVNIHNYYYEDLKFFTPYEIVQRIHMPARIRDSEK